MEETAYKPPSHSAQLEELMVAMDVVDTLRHEQISVARELDHEGRRERLLVRLRDIYAAQGITVADHVLADGIQALEDQRFRYQAPVKNWQTRLARVWVTRARWGKPVRFLTVFASLLTAVYGALEVYPNWQQRSALPTQITNRVNAIIALSQDNTVTQRALRLQDQGRALLDDEDYEQAQLVVSRLDRLRTVLQQEFIVRVVVRPGSASGVWRVPPLGQSKNYYLIVEAVGTDGTLVSTEILSEEDNSVKQVTQWGIRVDKTTFDRVASDKRDDGIIQNNLVGRKLSGFESVSYEIATSGGAITSW